MNTFFAAACVLTVMMCGGLTQPMTEETTFNSDGNTTLTTESLPVETTDAVQIVSERLNCSTARGLEGICVHRQFCEYSTIAIDLTVYMPSYYKRICLVGEVCCPFDYLTESSKPGYVPPENAFGFDDDD